MLANNGTIQLDGCRSYATEANLMKALEKFGFAEDRPLICRTRDGRWTAVFGMHLSGLAREGGYIGVYSSQGFMTID